jgi:hypothetical protein
MIGQLYNEELKLRLDSDLIQNVKRAAKFRSLLYLTCPGYNCICAVLCSGFADNTANKK